MNRPSTLGLPPTPPTFEGLTIEAIELPPGYTLEWDGEYNSSKESQEALIPGIVPTVVIMMFIIVVLFNAFRPPIIIFAVIPFVLIQIVGLGLFWAFPGIVTFLPDLF